MPFNQPAPQLVNQYADDRVLRSYLARVLPAGMLSGIKTELIELGELAGGELYRLQIADRVNEPVVTPWDVWAIKCFACRGWPPGPSWRSMASIP